MKKNSAKEKSDKSSIQDQDYNDAVQKTDADILHTSDTYGLKPLLGTNASNQNNGSQFQYQAKDVSITHQKSTDQQKTGSISSQEPSANPYFNINKTETQHLMVINSATEESGDGEMSNKQYEKLINSNTKEEQMQIIDRQLKKQTTSKVTPITSNPYDEIDLVNPILGGDDEGELGASTTDQYKIQIHKDAINRKKTSDFKTLKLPTKSSIDNRGQLFGKSVKGRENLKNYMDDYAITLDVPSLYVQDAKFFRTNPNYCLKLLNVVNPQHQDTILQNHWLNKNQHQTLSKDIDEDLSQGVILRIIKTTGKRITILKDILIKKVHFALTRFSFDGTFLVMFFKDLQQIKVCKINVIEQLLFQIEKEEYYAQYDGIKEKDIGFITHIEIDFKNRFIIGRGDKKVFIFNIENKKHQFYNLDRHLYDKIYNVRFVSSSDEEYRCQIACKKKDVKQIHIFEMFPKNEEDKKLKVLNFQHQPSDLTMVDISFDFKQIVFVNCTENFEIVDMGKDYVQRKLNQLQNKIVRYISHSPEMDGFYFVAHQEYDHVLDVEHSKRTDFLVDFDRDIAPGIIKIFDFVIISQDSIDLHTSSSGSILPNINFVSKEHQKEIKIISLCDDDFIIDAASYKEKFIPQKGQKMSMNKDYQTDNIVYNQFTHKPIGSFCISWPYLAFVSMNRFLVIWNVFENKTLHMVEIGDVNSNLFIEDTFVTQTNDLILVTRNDDKYSVLLIDLDNSNVREFEGESFDFDQQFKMQLLFQYKSEDVNNQPLINIHARGSSRKEAVDTNCKLVIFILHDKSLYSWVQIHEYSSNMEAFRFVSNYHSKEFMLIDDSRFIYLENFYDEKSKIKKQEIKSVQINFSTYMIQTVFTQSPPEQIISMNVDQIKMKIILLQEIIINQQDLEQKKKFRIYDINKKKITHESIIQQKALIGRLASGMYTFVDGHIYYNNNVIKIRYDILDKPHSQKYTEMEIFDFYFDIFQLNNNETVKASTPLDSFRSHRFGYIITNLQDLKPKRVMILPYLHDSRIYLNRLKLNTEYFYTSIDTTSEEALCKSNMHSHEVIKKDMHHKAKSPEQDTVTSIICYNLTEYKYYVYSQSGLLINRVNFEKIIHQYGVPQKATSSNGRVFIFQKTYEQIKKQSISQVEISTQMLNINIMEANISKFVHIKEISLYSIIQEIIPKESWVKKHTNLIDVIDIQFALNNKKDMILQIKQKCEDYNDFCEIEGEEQAYYFYIPNSPLQKTQMIEDDGSKVQDFAINDKYIFIWNSKQIKFYHLDSDNFSLDSGHLIDLIIQDTDKRISIQEVRCGCNPNTLIILINQSLETHLLFQWDIENNKEVAFYEIENQYRIVWDKQGNPYCLMKDKVLIFEQNCIIKAFNNFQVEDKKSILGQNGYKFDSQNHNWVIQQEYLSLPFSYMTFVILDKIERRDPLTQYNLFDPVPFNYIYNRRTFFLNSDIVKKDHVKLEKVIKNLESLDPELNDILNYTQQLVLKNGDDQTPKIDSALAIAHKVGNNKAVELLLKYLSKKKGESNIIEYQHLFPQLLQYKNFITFLKNLPIRTFQMERKQILKVKGIVNDQIVRITYFHTSYIDEMFFNNKMDESDLHTLEEQEIIKMKKPVNIQAVQNDWILNNDGKRFLESILNNENLDFYVIPSIQMIIEFLFSHFKKILLRSVVPLFVAQVLAFFMQMQFNEMAHQTLFKDVKDNNYILYNKSISRNYKDATPAEVENYKLILQILNVITFLIQIFEFRVIIVKFDGRNSNEVKWGKFFLDLLFIFVTVIINVQVILIKVLTEDPDSIEERLMYMRTIRYMSLIIIFLFFIKIVDIFTLFDEISPFVDIVFKIFKDIMFFLFIFTITMLCSAQCFYLVGQNQIYFDDITLAEYNTTEIRYDTMIRSLWYVWLLTLGEFNYDSFFLGNQGSTGFLIFIFCVSTFMMIVHLLNMLIAIMGSTYMSRSEVAHNIRTRDHLKFVIENWHLLHSFKERNKMKYIICAFVDRQNTDIDTQTLRLTEMIYQMQGIFQQNQELTLVKQNDLQIQMKNIHQKIEMMYQKDNYN